MPEHPYTRGFFSGFGALFGCLFAALLVAFMALCLLIGGYAFMAGRENFRQQEQRQPN